MTRMLTGPEIHCLVTRSGVRPAAIENFLSSADNALPKEGHIQNAIADARAYGWNAPTLNAILTGLRIMYKGGC